MSLTGCSGFFRDPVPVYVERGIPAPLLKPCPEPTKGSRTEGGLAELSLGWRATARCNAGKLESVGRILADKR
ncbi:Rz1-like lysis system protein LysC [Phaeobacter italicus]